MSVLYYTRIQENNLCLTIPKHGKQGHIMNNKKEKTHCQPHRSLVYITNILKDDNVVNLRPTFKPQDLPSHPREGNFVNTLPIIITDQL